MTWVPRGLHQEVTKFQKYLGTNGPVDGGGGPHANLANFPKVPTNSAHVWIQKYPHPLPEVFRSVPVTAKHSFLCIGHLNVTT